MSRAWPAVAGLAAMLAGCGEPAPDQPVRHIQVENPHHDGLARLSPEMRHLGLMRAIRDSGARCQRVDAGAYQEEYRGLRMWVARCNDGREWALFIAPNGDVQVRACADTGQIGLPECRLDEALAREGSGQS